MLGKCSTCRQVSYMPSLFLISLRFRAVKNLMFSIFYFTGEKGNRVRKFGWPIQLIPAQSLNCGVALFAVLLWLLEEQGSLQPRM